MSYIFDIVAIFTALFGVVYAFFQWRFRHWERKGLPYLKPTFPFGNAPNPITHRARRGDVALTWYKEMKKLGLKHAGVFGFHKPLYVVIDPDYIKSILIKDFQHFTDRGQFHDENADPLSVNLFTLDGQEWKQLRYKLTPTFTSGKIKRMFDTLVQCTGPFIEAMDKMIDEEEPIDIKEMLARYTTDVIGSCAFGIECNNFKNPNSEFRKHGANAFAGRSLIKVFILFLRNEFPRLASILRIKEMDKEGRDFFMRMVKDTIDYREKNGVKRDDYLQMLMKLRDENHWSFAQVASQSLIFFFAGFETSSTTMTFALYELCRHPEMQRKVHEEVTGVLAKNDGKFTYENLKEMTYLQQVLDETLRLRSPAEALARVCSKDYPLPGTNAIIDKGTTVMVPVKGLHSDPDYFPDQEKFDPERFSPENKAKMKSCVYLPFRDGPRNCIGLRFGILQSKLGLAVLLKNYYFTINNKTIQPIRMCTDTLVPSIEGGLWLNGKKIKD
nr:cytochrome P450 monooxygenase CYP6BK30 [Lasioderma serricorne]